MSFFRFVFSFLYVRNWHNGRSEVSRPRLTILLAIIVLLVLSIALIAFLQAPIEYTNS